MLLMAVFAPLAMMGQSQLTIYEDGTATSSYVPVHGLWADAYLKCEFVVPTNQLGAMTGGTISQMDFYLTSPAGAAWTGTFQVFLMEVDDETISAYYGPGNATIVYEGQLDGTQDIMTVAFSNNYTYGGNDLLVGVYQIEKGNYKSATFAGASVTGASGQGYNSSSLANVTFNQRNFIPKTTFTYTIGGVVCEKPENIEVSNIGTNGATVTWTGGSGTYNLEIKGGSYADWTPVPNMTNTTATTATLSALEPGTGYQVRVQSVCSGDATSGWKSVNFTTECGAITTFPWTETFESYNAGEFSDPCWINERIQDGEGSGTLSIFKVSTSAMGGNSTHQLQLPDMPGGTLTKLVLPEMNVPANYEFSIDIYRSSNTYQSNPYELEGIRVYASTNGEIEGATELAFIPRHFEVSNAVIPAESEVGWYTYELPIGMSGTCHIILLGQSQYCTATYMDNLTVKPVPTCPKPSGLAVTANSVTAHNATITWTENGEANTWVMEFSTDEDFTTFLLETVEDTPTLTFHGLEPETTYYVRVKAHCGPGDESEYSNVVNFTTTIACPAPTNLAANPGNYSAKLNWKGTSNSYIVSYRTAAYADGIVEEFNTSGVPSGWTRYSGLVDDVIAGEATLTTVTAGWSTTSYALGQYNMKVNIYGTSCKYWLVTPEFNLSQNLSFDLALTDFGNADPIEDLTAQADDRFIVLIYADDEWIILREWNNNGSEYVYNDISATGENVTIDLSGFYGQDVKIAFYGESTNPSDMTNTGGDNDLHIDNVICGIPYAAGEWQTVTVSDTTATITGLTPLTAYDARVLSDCGELDSLSLWTPVITFTTLEDCPVPQNVEVDDITYNSATVSWDGYNDNYLVSYRTAAYVDGVIEHFDASGLPSGWTRYGGLVDDVIAGDATLTSVSGYWNTTSTALGQYNMKLNIYGTTIHHWLVTPEFNLSQNLSFDLALTDYNNEDPIEDPTAQADDRFIVLIYADDAWHILREWNNSGSDYVYNTISTTGENVTINLSAYYGKKVQIAFYGESTSSSDENAGDNDLHIDNIVCGVPVEASEWETIEATESPVILTGLTPETPYEVKLQGICDGEPTEETEIVTFTTPEITTLTQTIALTAGTNWISTYVNITLDDLKDALVAALPGTTMMIKAKDSYTTYNGSRWRGQLNTLDLAQMYMITVSSDCEITLEGEPVNPAELTINISNGPNWIAFPFSESMTVANAFADFSATSGDMLKSMEQYTAYNGSRWRGQLNTLVPGQGYIYNSVSSEVKPFTYPTNTSKAAQMETSGLLTNTVLCKTKAKNIDLEMAISTTNLDKSAKTELNPFAKIKNMVKKSIIIKK